MTYYVEFDEENWSKKKDTPPLRLRRAIVRAKQISENADCSNVFIRTGSTHTRIAHAVDGTLTWLDEQYETCRFIALGRTAIFVGDDRKPVKEAASENLGRASAAVLTPEKKIQAYIENDHRPMKEI